MQNRIFSTMRAAIKERKIGVVCDMNGSARAESVDAQFFAENGIQFYAIHNKAGDIAHEIIPEAENLVYVAAEMERLQKEGKKDAVLGYMPDCDGDRGNIVYWDEKAQKAVILKAQEVFSLSVLAELSYSCWLNGGKKDFKPAVAVNCPTSMRIEEIAGAFKAAVFRAEVGEANVVNCAAEKRAVLHIATKDHSVLKARFQNVFDNEWAAKKDALYEKYGILFWECVITNGTKETRRVTDFSKSGKGGLKIIFYNGENQPTAFIWMRGSGTEPVFRIMCDVKGDNPQMEKELLQWLTEMLELADK